MMQKNIALLLESDGPGGAERMLLHLAIALRARGHHVVPVGPANGCGWLASQFCTAGFKPEFFNLRGSIDPLCVLGLTSIFQKYNIDVVHSHEFTMAVYGTAATLMSGIPHVITMHGGEYFASTRRRRRILRWACLNSNTVITVSEASRQRLINVLQLPHDHVRVVRNGITFFAGDGTGLRKEIGTSSTQSIITAVGNLYPVKGHMVLLQALVQLNATHPSLSWKTIIVGRGDEESNLLHFISRHGLTDRVHLLGYRHDINDVVAAADIIALPSLSEGLPLALLEAMFAGKPIVASETGGIPEAVSHGRDALLVPPGNPEKLATQLGNLLTNPDLREQLGYRAQIRAQSEFGLGNMAAAYENIYQHGIAA